MQTTTDTTLIAFENINREKHNRYRNDYDENRLVELAESIRENGLFSPILCEIEVDDESGEETYSLVAGGRRMAAIELIREDDEDFMEDGVPCMLVTGDDADMKAATLIENIQREDTDPDSQAQCVWDLLQDGMEGKEVARKIGRSPAWVSQCNQYITKASDKTRRLVREGKLSFSAGRKVAEAGDAKAQAAAVKEAEADAKASGEKRPTAAKVTKATGGSTRPSAKELELELAATEAKIKEASESDDEDTGKDSPTFYRLVGRREGLKIALGKGKVKRLYAKPKKAKKPAKKKSAKKATGKKAAPKKTAKKGKNKKAIPTKKSAKSLPTED